MDYPEVTKLGRILVDLGREFHKIARAERKKRWSGDTEPTKHLISAARQWGFVYHARNDVVRMDVLRDTRYWEEAPRQQLLSNQVAWAANNMKKWSDDPNRVKVISPWMNVLAEVASAAKLPGKKHVIEAARLCRHDHFVHARGELSKALSRKE